MTKRENKRLKSLVDDLEKRLTKLEERSDQGKSTIDDELADKGLTRVSFIILYVCNPYNVCYHIIRKDQSMEVGTMNSHLL